MADLVVQSLLDADKRRETVRHLLQWTNANFSYQAFENEVMSTVKYVLRKHGRRGINSRDGI